ncbi:MAG: response regulator [Dehalococcoidia bacterium]|nr:response regulator [Dehalococcoidia bacterium]
MASQQQTVDAPAKALQVLLVEDNDLDVEIAKRVFAKSGVAVYLHIARDGQEALDFLWQRRNEEEQPGPLPDLALLDLNLPMVDGIQILRRMKSDPRLSAIPVVVLTGESSERPLRECMELGTNLYLMKPMAISDVLNVFVGVQRYWTALDGLET